jgi:hypothetical protein
MKVSNIFIGTPQSFYAGIAVLISFIVVSIAIIFGKTKLSVSNKIGAILLLLVVSAPGVLFSLFQLTCLVTGSGRNNQRWWCSVYAWIISALLIVYSILVVAISIMSIITRKNIEKFADSNFSTSAEATAAIKSALAAAKASKSVDEQAAYRAQATQYAQVAKSLKLQEDQTAAAEASAAAKVAAAAKEAADKIAADKAAAEKISAAQSAAEQAAAANAIAAASALIAQQDQANKVSSQNTSSEQGVPVAGNTDVYSTAASVSDIGVTTASAVPIEVRGNSAKTVDTSANSAVVATNQTATLDTSANAAVVATNQTATLDTSSNSNIIATNQASSANVAGNASLR